MIKHFKNGYEYSDLSPDMSMSWDKDVGVVKGSQAVKNSIIGILSTRQGSRPFDPNFGCNLTEELFENMTILTSDVISTEIVRAIKAYEPRVEKESLRVIVTPLYDQNAVEATVVFKIISATEYYEQLTVRLGKDNDYEF